MSFAWETTPDDVALVLNRHAVGGDADAICDEHFDEAACARIERQVLRCGDFDEHTDAAQDEIEEILNELGILPKRSS